MPNAAARYVAYALVASLASVLSSPWAEAGDFASVELERWNGSLENENWRLLFGGREHKTLGMFMSAASDTEAQDSAKSISDCGMDLVTLTRTRFTSPPTPPELRVSTSTSRQLSGPIGRIMQSVPRISSATIRLANPRWVRMLPSNTSSLLFASAIWGNPGLRAKLIQCVQERASDPLVESVLRADITLSFYDHNKKKLDVDQEIRAASSAGLFLGVVTSRQHTYSLASVTLARRVGLCVNAAIYFRNAAGDAGTETCP